MEGEHFYVDSVTSTYNYSVAANAIIPLSLSISMWQLFG